MRGSSSFSTSDYKGRRGYYRGSFRKGGPSFRTSSRVRFAPTKNSRDRNGNVMLCSFCNSWFHLILDCPDWHKHSSVHYGEVEEANTTNDEHHQNTPPPRDILHMDRSIDEYNFTPNNDQPTPMRTEPANESTKPQQFNTFFAHLAYNIQHEVVNPKHEYYLHNRPYSPPDVHDLYRMHRKLHFDPLTSFHGICFDEGAPHSVTGINQWMAYLCKYPVPQELKKIQPTSASLIYGGKGKKRVVVESIGKVAIRAPLPAECYFDY